MRCATTCILFTLAMVGCQSSYRSPAPPGLEDRLARVADTRLAQASADVPPSNRGGRAATGLAANQRPRRAGEIDIAEQYRASGDLPALTMVDLGERQGTGTASNTDAQSPKSHASSLHEPPFKSFWETAARDLKDAPSDLWRDTKRVYANPVNLAILGVAYGGSLAIQEGGPDSTVEHRFNRNNDFRAPDHIMNNSGWRDAFAAAGNPATHFALAGAWYLLGQQTMDDKTYEVGKTLFSALLINGMTVMVGQTASWDRAPNGEWGTFPSGHTSSAFVFASVMQEAYGHLVGLPLYGLATLVGVARLDDREHYFSDVCMGAVLGTVVGHAVASGRDPEFFGWKILPYASPQNGSGVAFMKTLE